MLDLAHKNLKARQMGVDFVAEIYKLTSNYPQSETYGLTSQIRKAAISIPANMAEGSARRTQADRGRFFEISRSYLVELDTHLEISKRIGYCADEDLDPHSDALNEMFALLTGLIDRARQ